MITNNPFSTPGFFQQAAFPILPSILPGTVDMGPGSMAQAPQVSPTLQADYMKHVLTEMMASMQDVQKSFAMYLGTPPGGPIGGQPAPGAPPAPKK